LKCARQRKKNFSAAVLSCSHSIGIQINRLVTVMWTRPCVFMKSLDHGFLSSAILVAWSDNIGIFCDVMLCILVHEFERFGGTSDLSVP
jgi:hypothetical protein